MGMVAVLLFLTSFFLFAISSRGLILALTENVVLLSFESGYSKRALKVGKGYKVFAWSVLTLFLFYTAVQSFIYVFQTF
jgi:hypothetical protein